jgi:hypothetical protein
MREGIRSSQMLPRSYSGKQHASPVQQPTPEQLLVGTPAVLAAPCVSQLFAQDLVEPGSLQAQLHLRHLHHLR